MVKVLSVIPPLVQINTPYPATSFITGFLRSIDHDAVQADIGLSLVLELFSKNGLGLIRDGIVKPKSDIGSFFLEAFSEYEKTIEIVIRFLQGKDSSIAHRIAARTLLPEGPRFQSVAQDDLNWAFGQMGVQDQAKHLASLYIDDLADLIAAEVDPEFTLSRYGEKLAASQPTFEPLLEKISKDEKVPTLIDRLLEKVLVKSLIQHEPDFLVITIPFPGCMLGALKIAKIARQWKP